MDDRSDRNAIEARPVGPDKDGKYFVVLSDGASCRLSWLEPARPPTLWMRVRRRLQWAVNDILNLWDWLAHPFG